MLRGDEAKCQLVSSAFSWLVQFCLGVAAFSTLVVKGFTERPRRRFCVWCVDVLKQGSSGCMNHFLNIGIALWLTGGESDEDECAWYFVNFAINTVIGGAVSWALLRLVELAAGSTKWPCCRGRAACIALAVSGEYGQNGDAAIASAQMTVSSPWMRTSWDSRGRTAAETAAEAESTPRAALLAGSRPAVYAGDLAVPAGGSGGEGGADGGASGGGGNARSSQEVLSLGDPQSCVRWLKLSTRGLRIWWALQQLVVWCIVIAVMSFMLAVPLYLVRVPLATAATGMFKPIASWQPYGPDVELVVVMVACPFLLNTAYYWIMCVVYAAVVYVCLSSLTLSLSLSLSLSFRVERQSPTPPLPLSSQSQSLSHPSRALCCFYEYRDTIIKAAGAGEDSSSCCTKCGTPARAAMTPSTSEESITAA